MPDENGHIPGWVPVDPSLRQHLWHLSSVDYTQQICLILEPDQESDQLVITAKKLQDYIGTTFELIGTNVNANPYRIGSKQQPLHFLVRHGSIPVKNLPELKNESFKTWFSTCESGMVEGIVWHCADGNMFKLHRHHLGLKWPVENAVLNSYPIKLDIDTAKFESEFGEKSLFSILGKMHGQVFKSLKDIVVQ